MPCDEGHLPPALGHIYDRQIGRRGRDATTEAVDEGGVSTEPTCHKHVSTCVRRLDECVGLRTGTADRAWQQRDTNRSE